MDTATSCFSDPQYRLALRYGREKRSNYFGDWTGNLEGLPAAGAGGMGAAGVGLGAAGLGAAGLYGAHRLYQGRTVPGAGQSGGGLASLWQGRTVNLPPEAAAAGAGARTAPAAAPAAVGQAAVGQAAAGQAAAGQAAAGRPPIRGASPAQIQAAAASQGQHLPGFWSRQAQRLMGGIPGGGRGAAMFGVPLAALAGFGLHRAFGRQGSRSFGRRAGDFADQAGSWMQNNPMATAGIAGGGGLGLGLMAG